MITSRKKLFRILGMTFFFVSLTFVFNGIHAQETEGQTTPAKVEEKKSESLIDWIVKGGITMIPLALVTTLIIALCLERYFYFRRQNATAKGYYERVAAIVAKDGLKGLTEFVSNDKQLISRILSEGLQHKSEGRERVEAVIQSASIVELGKLEKGLSLINNIGNLAPLLGFFGTVTGMRNTFLQFVEKAAPTARDLAGGVEEALITTIAGLMIAMPTFFVHNLFIYRIDEIAIEIERCNALISSKL